MRSEFFLFLTLMALLNANIHFQLAEEYQNEARFEEAIDLYKTVLNVEKSKESLWKTKLALGECFKTLNQWPEALHWYLEAFQTDPTRPEPLLEIAVYYRIEGENDLAYLFAKHGAKAFPARNYQFDHELSIVSYYTRFKEDGYKAASDLVIRKNVPWHIKEQAYQNVLFYTQNLKNARFHPIEIDLPLIDPSFDEYYHPANPSIQKTADGYKVICRAVNYTQKGARDFYPIDPDGYVRTKNFLVHYTPDLRLKSQQEIIEDLPRERSFTHVLGLEDCRIFGFQNQSWFTCTTRDTNPTGTPQISLAKLPDSNPNNQGELFVEKLIPLIGPEPNRCEKNWLPFVLDSSLHLIYSYDPFTILKPNIYTGECEVHLCYEPSWDFSYLKGSAGPLPFENGYLILVHETVILPDHSRVYLHRFLYLDQHFYAKQISKPFTFLHQGVEFCNSMTFNHAGTELILAIGLEDSKAYLCTIDLKTIRLLLTPLPLRL